MDGTKYGLNLSLQNLSLISIAAKLWDSQDIKNRLKNDFSGPENKCSYNKKLCEISKLVFQYTNSMNLPTSLSVLLKNTIFLLGNKIFDWIIHVTQNLKLDWIFTEKIYFSFGLIDEVKIFDLYWRDLMAADNFKCESWFFNYSPLFLLACIYGCESFIKEHKNEMLDELSPIYTKIREGDEIYNIMSVSICMTGRKIIIGFGDVPPPQEIFKLCIEEGYSKAARFYWEKLKKVEKVSNVAYFAEKCFRRDGEGFLLEKHWENLLFLINQMEMHLFFKDHVDKIILLSLPFCQCQELIIDLLKCDWDIESSKLKDMAAYVIWSILYLDKLECPVNNRLKFEIVRKAWGYMPVNDKLKFVENLNKNKICLFLTLNLKIINLVYNDPSFKEVCGDTRYNRLIKKGYVELVKIRKFDFLNEIIEESFNLIPEPKEFLKENFPDFFLDLMKKDPSYGLVDSFLDWSTDSEAERANLKNQLNTISVCRSLTEPELSLYIFELAEKFLKWRFETDAEIKNFKEEMKSYNFVISGRRYVRIKSGDLNWLRPGDLLDMTHLNGIKFDNADGFTFLKFEDAIELNQKVVVGLKFGSLMDNVIRSPVTYVGTKVGDFISHIVGEIWKSKLWHQHNPINFGEVVKLCNAFIKFYYETDEEVLQFKKTKLQVLYTENVAELLQPVFYRRDYTPKDFLEYFLKFCMVSSKKLREIETQKRSDIEKFLDTYLIDQCDCELVDFYVNRLFGEVKKTEVIKTFLNSSNKGALLCVSYLKKWSAGTPSGSLKFEICRWLSMIDDLEKLKNDVFALSENPPEWFIDFLDDFSSY